MDDFQFSDSLVAAYTMLNLIQRELGLKKKTSWLGRTQNSTLAGGDLWWRSSGEKVEWKRVVVHWGHMYYGEWGSDKDLCLQPNAQGYSKFVAVKVYRCKDKTVTLFEHAIIKCFVSLNVTGKVFTDHKWR